MPILKALGFGVAILVLKVLVPAVFEQLEATVVAVLRTAELGASAATNLAASVADAPDAPALRLALPQAPQVSP